MACLAASGNRRTTPKSSKSCSRLTEADCYHSPDLPPPCNALDLQIPASHNHATVVTAAATLPGHADSLEIPVALHAPLNTSPTARRKLCPNRESGASSEKATLSRPMKIDREIQRASRRQKCRIGKRAENRTR